ncbi:molybdopterin converting factor subunit 1 [Staphylococcus felis]|uniref:Molybdopterin synthase sulfur carrier subunit n=1 Tax=Staphylococcus felis TaxID=46127 RepID=A0ABS0QR51_9STAP|nr:molybdopterin converting factor subunit 1 [Staphylococcus felis]MBH9581668.1 molybdopterin converting factor subunit 1 [Staphylococcus felis]MDM8326781.1 molybdopterin converting factor subunit 1 [Staphylococcus felis]MDQ7192117.1 molybdopterin converting factor subunit 1 [Staphylococcus felis]REH77242.1 molybdopterin converting factor subunit 1 [Staphylococcus felis]REH84869.1 molybdopterin converting factor subunit 1 [Staphylococcus felis]
MKILYFAELKELVNRTEDAFPFDYEISVEQLKQHLYSTYPVIQGKKFQVAVNEEFVRDNDTVKPNDIVALIPPVSGG